MEARLEGAVRLLLQRSFPTFLTPSLPALFGLQASSQVFPEKGVCPRELLSLGGQPKFSQRIADGRSILDARPEGGAAVSRGPVVGREH